MSNTKQFTEEYVVHTYNRFPVVLEKGEGVYLYDEDGKKYLDFASGIGVCSLGYGNEKVSNALKNQINQLMHTSNLFYNEPSANAAKKLVESTGLKKAFFTNSGAEAIEGALKMAKRYAYDKSAEKESGAYSKGYEVIARNSSYHGRTMGALGITGTENYRKPFGPEDAKVKFATFNDLDSVKALVNDDTCAIIFECVQGEGGVTPATDEFVKGVRALCDEKDIIMICDEVQCGMGRTGKMWGFEHFGVKPDIVTCAKALGCGVPVGAFVAGPKCCESLVPGDHGTTYGGNPLVTAAVNAVFDEFEDKQVVLNAQVMGESLGEKLEELAAKKDNVKAVKGIGLMRGLELETPVGDAVKAAIDKGLLVISAGGNVLRMLPPLVITKADIDYAIKVLEEVL